MTNPTTETDEAINSFVTSATRAIVALNSHAAACVAAADDPRLDIDAQTACDALIERDLRGTLLETSASQQAIFLLRDAIDHIRHLRGAAQ